MVGRFAAVRTLLHAKPSPTRALRMPVHLIPLPWARPSPIASKFAQLANQEHSDEVREMNEHLEQAEQRARQLATASCHVRVSQGASSHEPESPAKQSPPSCSSVTPQVPLRECESQRCNAVCT